MKNAEEEDKSKSSFRSSKSSAWKASKGSKTSKESRSSRGSKSSKEKELEDKIRVAKLVAEAELLEQKQIIECEAQKLKIKEELAKARARVSAYTKVKPINFEEAITHKEKKFEHDSRYHRPDYTREREEMLQYLRFQWCERSLQWEVKAEVNHQEECSNSDSWWRRIKDDMPACETAKPFVSERYGVPYRIIAAYRKEIKHWPQIKAGDANAYQKFQNFLVKPENIGHFQSMNVLDTLDIIYMLLSKSLDSVREKWSRNV